MGGYIASEFASIFNGLDSKVHQIFRGNYLMRGFDKDLTKHITNEMAKQGICMHPQSSVTKISKTPDNKLLLHTSQDETIEVDAVMYATGRSPNVENLGLDQIGVTIGENGLIDINDKYETSINNIFAIGGCL